MLDKAFTLVDIETNGGSGERGRVIEIAAIKVENGEVVDTFQSLVNPGSAIPYWTTQLTGIENGDVEEAPYFEEIAESLYQFMSGSVFVAHNVLFDYSFLRRQFKESGLNFTPKLFCTVRMSRALYPEHRGHSLEKIIKRHELKAKSRHRAYDDAFCLYQFMQIAIRDKGIDAFSENFLLQTKTKSLPPNVDEESILALPEQPGIYIFEDDEGSPLYVGKSVNIRSRVRSHFTNATSVAKEMKLTLHSHNIRFITTETEVEALLLESAKIKELQPLYNRLLRRKNSQSVLMKRQDHSGYLSITIENRDLAQVSDLSDIYGVYSTKNQAKKALESTARTYQLCPILLGLEKGPGPCFRYQLGLCRGACIQKEAPESYNQRLEFALERSKIASWPFASKVAIAISSKRSIVMDQWIAEGIIEHDDQAFTALDNGFDVDTYKIIRSFIKIHNPQIKLLGEGLW